MEQPRFADAARATRHMFIRDLVLSASIGVYAHEHEARQRIRINLDLAIQEEPPGKLSRPSVGRDDLARVVDYESIVIRTREIVNQGHVQLVETLAERLAEACLTDSRVAQVRVRVEKLDVFADAASAGVEIERRNC
ncbi:MAG: dihydroneopterin aldolase [Acidocella sp. 20-57-95]|nr:MAG: dihydroneopterin aldolase [Acidocella sp. 20-57-95]HQT64188.1 dihydroneopterin aldolase [Acidocella sp.]